MRLGMMTLVASDYDEAIAYFTCKLVFTLVEDTAQSDQKRWVCVAPSVDGTRLLLAKATNDEQLARIGDQCGGRIVFFLYTADFDRDYSRMVAAGIEGPREETYGRVVVFLDCYWNK